MRSQDFYYEKDITPGKTIPRIGAYQRREWKTWGNNEQGDGTEISNEKAMLGRRYHEEDKECKQRYILVSVIAKDDDAEVLLELQSMTFFASHLQKATVLGLLTLSFLSF